MPDYNQGGFTQGSDGGIYGDPGNGGGSVSDYDTWDWKQIKAAVYGSAAASEPDAEAHALAVSNPQSLQDAAEVFLAVQRTLEMVAQSLLDQAKALAGNDGPWKGAAADSFLDMMTTFSKQVRANAEVLSGGATGRNSVPQQLANNAVSLATARDLVERIDVYYAAVAQKMNVTTMSNGLTAISEKAQLVNMMTDQMRQVLKSLAGEYQISIDAIRSPSGVTSPIGTPPGAGAIDPNAGAIDPNAGTGVPNAGTIDPNAGTGVPSPAPIDPGSGGMPGGAGGMGDPGTGGGAPVPYMGDLSTAPGGPPINGGAAGLPPLDPAAMDAALNPGAPRANPGSLDVQPFPGGTDVGLGTGGGAGGIPALPGIGVPASFGGRAGAGGTGKLPTSSGLADPSTWGSPAPAPFPGSTSVGGAAANLTGPGIGKGLPLLNSHVAGIPTVSGLPSSGLPSLSVPGLSGEATGSGLGSLGSPLDAAGMPSSLAQLGTGTGAGLGGPMGMPMMPGMGGGAPGSSAGSGERSDASGLLGQSADPWTGDTSVGTGQVGSSLGAPAGGASLDLPNAAALPTAGAGLPSFDSGVGTGGVGSGLGAPAGGAGLNVPGMAMPPTTGAGLPSSSVPGVSGGSAGSDLGSLGSPGNAPGVPSSLGQPETGAGLGGPMGMPMMPGMSGGAPGSSAGSGERSDASGLLGHSADPWTGDTSVGAGQVGSGTGTPAGGAGLDLPSVAAYPTTGAGLPSFDTGLGNGGAGLGVPGMTIPPIAGVGLPSSSVPGLSGGSAGSGLGSPGSPPKAAGVPSSLGQPGTGAGSGGSVGVPSSLGQPGTGAGSGGPVGMPMMPGMSGGAPGSSAGSGERSDASGLLGQSADPWTGEAGLGNGEVGSGLGAPAGGTGLDLPGMVIPPIAGPVPGRSRERSEASGLLEGERTDWTAGGRPLEEARGTEAGVLAGDMRPDAVPVTGAPVQGVTGGFGTPHDLPDDRVAVLRHPGPDTAEDTSAWNTGSASFVPLLWPLRDGEEESDETIPGYASADEGTWDGTESLPAAPAGTGRTLSAGGDASETDSSGDPHLAAWRPVHRSGTAAAGTALSGVEPRLLGCGDAPFDPDEDDQAGEAGVDDEEDDAEEQHDKRIANLLVQDESVWGVPARGTRREG